MTSVNKRGYVTFPNIRLTGLRLKINSLKKAYGTFQEMQYFKHKKCLYHAGMCGVPQMITRFLHRCEVKMIHYMCSTTIFP